ncbi:MAG TPA: hypothetical protein VFD66_09315 [Verrucomicrobiae bacterium]|nr:hypothetical protein [Verrucomicrobiae bacterium]
MRTFVSSVFVLACTASVLLAQPYYAVVDLGTLGGTNSRAFGLNNHGVIVGDAMRPDGSTHAFAFTNGVMMDLGTLGGTNSHAYSVNDMGHIVGSADLTNGMRRGFFATNAMGGFMMTNLGTLGGTNSAAYCINAMDAITGEADLPSGLSHAFVWTNMTSGMMDIDASDTASSAGYWMNASGQVVGYASFNGAMRAFMTGSGMMGGGMTDMGTMGGGSSVANSVNSQSTGVGASLMSDGSQHAFYSTSGGMGGMTLHDLGTLGGTNSQAFCINTTGDIVGTADTTSGAPHAFMYSGGMIHDLNAMIPTNSGWQLIEAYGINDTNQIVGSGMMGSQMHAFLLTPVSAPVQISAMPTNMILGPGANIQMNVAMITGDTLRYQWMFNGTNMPGQTNATLVLSAMQPMMAGQYNIVVSNPIGMVADLRAGVAMLMMQKPSGSGLSLTLYGPLNGKYRIDQTASLGPATSWSMMTNLSLTTNPCQVTIKTGNSPMQFYRATPTP